MAATTPNPRSRRYPPVTDGQWVQPVRRGYRMQCCDCGLVHQLNFRLVPRGAGHTIQLQAFRRARSTAAVRRERRKACP
jgi:hypothetical protein